MSKPAVDPYKIFVQADSFRNSVEIILSESGSFDSRDKTIPAIVNIAFAVELYLKCLLALENGGFPRGHNLEDLFAALTPASRDKITVGYKAILAQNPSIVQDANTYAKRIAELVTLEGGQPIPTPGTDIDSVLSNCKNAFQQFRYAFEPSNEKRDANLILLDAILFSIKEVILELNPDWLNPQLKSAFIGTTVTGVNENFIRVVQSLSPAMEYGDVNFGCPTGLHGFKLGFTLVPGMYGVFPRIKEGRDVIIWPTNDEFVCPACGATADVKLLREYIEQYTGKKVQQVL